MPINRYGGGARTNENGLRFEQETKLSNELYHAGYVVLQDGTVLNGTGTSLGMLAEKYKLYSRILKPRGIDWKDHISKQLLPDEAFYNYLNNTVYIIEKKFQHDSGSVDEKLQTCDFKKKQYQKLFSLLNLNVEYIYVCNEWFSDDKYRDVHNYIRSVGCHIFFNEIPLYFLGL